MSDKTRLEYLFKTNNSGSRSYRRRQTCTCAGPRRPPQLRESTHEEPSDGSTDVLERRYTHGTQRVLATEPGRTNSSFKVGLQTRGTRRGDGSPHPTLSVKTIRVDANTHLK